MVVVVVGCSVQEQQGNAAVMAAATESAEGTTGCLLAGVEAVRGQGLKGKGSRGSMIGVSSPSTQLPAGLPCLNLYHQVQPHREGKTGQRPESSWQFCPSVSRSELHRYQELPWVHLHSSTNTHTTDLSDPKSGQ